MITSTHPTAPSGAKLRLSIMMFLQFFVWGAWFATLGSVLGGAGLSGIIGDAYGAAPIAAIIAPLFLGLIADRFFPSQIVMGVLFLIGAGLMFMIPGATSAASSLGATFQPLFDQLKLAPEAATLIAAKSELAGKPADMLTALGGVSLGAGTKDLLAQANAAYAPFAAASTKVTTLILAHLLCYMPTLGLGNTISFANLERQDFPKVRVWGTIGWIVAGLAGGFLSWSASPNLFWMAGGAAALLGIFCFLLPNTPPPAKGSAINLRSLLMMDAFKMLGNPAFLVFIVCSTLICIPLAYYYAFTSSFLGSTGFTQPVSSMTIGQMSEIFFMILIPFFFRRLGVKWMILIGMAAWVLRYLLFAYGAPQQVIWMLFGGIALHGICYDFFFVTGFMYTDSVADKSIRGQAQSMLVFFTQGVGMFFGFKFAGEKFGAVKESNDALSAAIKAATPQETLSFGKSLSQMFNVQMPKGVDPSLISKATANWKEFWTLPAYMAAGIGVLFLIAFWDKKHDKGEADAADVAKAASPDEESAV